MDAQPKYLTAEQEAEEIKENKERRIKALEDVIKALPDQRFSGDYLAQHAKAPVNIEYLGRELARTHKRLTRRFFEEIFNVIDEMTEFVIFQRNRCRKLEAEVAELKSAGPNMADAYKGPWMIGAFKRGNIVTHGGSLFLALADTAEKPGTGDCWKLICKRGADGKDLRG